MADADDTVSGWLRSADLSYAIPNFRMAGIVSPRSFAELELAYFEPLGVTKAEDRKQLFYLIHKVKRKLAEEEEKRRRPRQAAVEGRGGGRFSFNLDGEEASARGREGGPPVGGQDDGDDDAEDDDDEYASEEFADEEEPAAEPARGTDAAGDAAGRPADAPRTPPRRAPAGGESHPHDPAMPTVDVPTRMPPISPVTLSSPIARMEERDGGGGGGATLASARERLAALLRRRPDEQAGPDRDARARLAGDVASDGLGEQDEARRRRLAEGLGMPDAGGYSGSGSVSSAACSRRSSVAARPSHAPKNKAEEASRGTGKAVDDLDACLLSDGEEDAFLGRGEADSLATPKTVTSSVVDVRSRRSSGLHHRQTIRKANKTKGGRDAAALKKHRRRSGIPAPLQLDDDSEGKEEDDSSLASDTSDLSTSLRSFRSRGSSSKSSRRRSSFASLSTVGTAYSSLGAGSATRADENRGNGDAETTASRRKPRPSAGDGAASRRGRAAAHGTQKRLSTIPSSSIAPLSPLDRPSSTQLEQLMHGGGGGGGGSLSTASSRRRRSGIGAAPATTGQRPASAARLRREDGEAPAQRGRSCAGDGSTGSVTTRGNQSARPARGGSHGRLEKGRARAHASDALAASSPGRPRRPLAVRDGGTSRQFSRSPAASSRGAARPARQPPRSPHSSRGTPRSLNTLSPRSRSPLSPKQTRRVAPSRNARGRSPPRSVSPVRTQRAVTPKKMAVVGARALSPVRSPLSSRTASPGRRARSPVNGGNGAIFVHGAPADTSWFSQIRELRSAFDSEHERQMTDPATATAEEEDGYEMRIRVLLRKRPMSNREASDAAQIDVIQPLDFGDHGRVLVHQPKTKLDLAKEVETTAFAFDNVFDEHASNAEIYEKAVMELIPGVFRGKWASVFAYGQTGSGKTFTMMGSGATGMRAGNSSKSNLGLYFLAAQDVFRIAEDPAYADISIGVSLFEIYGGKLLDLLNKRNPVKCLENSKGKVCFMGLSEHPVTDAETLMELIDAGATNRSTGTTSANADSSRSHAVIQLSLRKDVGRVKNKEHGRLTFIDLAGSERGADTAKCDRITRMEGAEINTSLLALKEVIRALATGSSLRRIPFRGSKLTQVLKESFVGKKSRTVMVSCVAPNMKNCDHTLNTLRYADRVKERNPQTGKLSAAIAANSKIKKDQEDMILRTRLPTRPLTAPAASFRINGEDSDDEGSVGPKEAQLQRLDEGTFVKDEGGESVKASHLGYNYGKTVDSDDDIYSLEDALNSPNSLPVTVPPLHQRTNPRPQTLKDDPAAQSLIATHRSILPQLLRMLQDEMVLVNETDVNRDMDDYLEQLQQISSNQLSLVSTLRASLDNYNTSKNTKYSLDETTEYDESFDLRD